MRQRVENVLNALVGRKQAEGKQHHLAFDAELVFEVGGVNEAHVGDSVRNHVDLGGRRIVDFLQHPPAALRHNNHASGKREQFAHDAALIGPGFAQDGMQRGDDRHLQIAQQGQDVTTGRSAEDSELVLKADDVNVADVEEIGGAQIGRLVLLFDFEAHHFRIIIAALDVVDGDREALALRVRGAIAASRSVVNVAMPHLRGR